MRILWSEEALAALADIKAYVAEDNPSAAVRLVLRLVERAETLIDFPHLGRVVPEYPGAGLRELVEGNYRIFYVVGSRVIEVVTVFEGHRLPPVEGVSVEDDEDG